MTYQQADQPCGLFVAPHSDGGGMFCQRCGWDHRDAGTTPSRAVRTISNVPTIYFDEKLHSLDRAVTRLHVIGEAGLDQMDALREIEGFARVITAEAAKWISHQPDTIVIEKLGGTK